LTLTASDLLDQFRKRGMDDVIQRSIDKRTLEAVKLEKIKGLIAKFEAAIQAHDAEVAAATSALEASDFAVIDHINASFSSFPSFSPEMPSLQTEGNPNVN
jgi:hypothetical protein